MSHRRYPGAQPFRTEQQGIFFGRNRDIEALDRLIKLEPLVVLYGKSGLGKSSLLNAGIVPRLRREGRFEPVMVRFGAWSGRDSETPVAITRLTLGPSIPSPTFLDELWPGDPSLWHVVKNRRVAGPEALPLVLIFDQFEELFTFPPAAVEEFKIQLAEMLRGQVPARYRSVLEKNTERGARPLSSAQLNALEAPLQLKAVLSIRADRMSLLDSLSDYLPTILGHNFALKPLLAEQAEDAILEPAYQKSTADRPFQAPVFDYSDEALTSILGYLTRGGTQPVESFQLQILCQSIEDRIIATGRTVVHAADVGDPADIFENYYESRMALLPDDAERLAARRLIEEGLILEEEERRLSLYEGQIVRQFHLSPALIARLVDTHLVRAEPSVLGGYSYELSHDTLVGPILQAKRSRQTQEALRAAETARREKEAELAAERRRRARARKMAVAGFSLATVAMLAFAVAFWQFRAAENARWKAQDAMARYLQEERGRRSAEAERQKLQVQTLRKQADYYLALQQPAMALKSLQKALLIDSTNAAIQAEYDQCLRQLGN